MTLRCKEGDLAIVVNDMEHPWNNGALVKVLRRADRSEYTVPVDWDCEAVTTIRTDGFTYSPGEADIGFRDRELRPIRDPGPDAVDETLRELETT